jgi:hypothetical protein
MKELKEEEAIWRIKRFDLRLSDVTEAFPAVLENH